LTSAFGSSGSLSGVGAASSHRAPILETITSHRGSDSDSVADSESSSRDSKGPQNGGSLDFDLGDVSHPKGFTNEINDDGDQVTQRSISIDPNSGRNVRPRTLASSLSESALPGVQRRSTASTPRSQPTTPVSNIVVEENSSPESTDSATIGNDKLKKRKKKGKLFRKILGKDTDHHKVK
jgi:hypothetical protein